MDDLDEIEEICQCGGEAYFAYWDESGFIPILKCKNCGDEFEAHEDNWREKDDLQG